MLTQCALTPFSWHGMGLWQYMVVQLIQHDAMTQTRPFRVSPVLVQVREKIRKAQKASEVHSCTISAFLMKYLHHFRT